MEATWYTPTEEAWQRLREIAGRKDAGDGSDPFHRRWNEDLNIIGLLGEALFAHLAACPVGDLGARRDGGFDFPGVDVKTTSYWRDPYLKWKAHQQPKAAVYFLAAADVPRRRVRPVGFATREMVEAAALVDFGGHGANRALHERDLLSACELIPRLQGEVPRGGWVPGFAEAGESPRVFEPPVVQAARLRDVDWLCSSCRERGFRPVQVAVRDGLCGWCWLTASKNGAA